MNFKLFGFERTGRRLFQKCVVRTKLDIYVFITVDNDVPYYQKINFRKKMPEGGVR
jgi:predicted N-acetyltransferase YhbS